MQYSNNTLVPWPEQVGNGKVPTLLAGNADGIHSLGASLGPKVMGNTIANIGDDAIAIHGLFFVVAKVGNHLDYACRLQHSPRVSTFEASSSFLFCQARCHAIGPA